MSQSKRKRVLKSKKSTMILKIEKKINERMRKLMTTELKRPDTVMCITSQLLF